MGAAAVAALDAELRAALDELVRDGLIDDLDGRLRLDVAGSLVVGRPSAPQ